MTDTTDAIVVVTARAIANSIGDDYDSAFKNKSNWIAERGMSGGRFREANEPYQSDYDDIARKALAAALPMLREDVERAHRTAQYDPAPYTKGKAAIRARFDAMAKELEQ